LNILSRKHWPSRQHFTRTVNCLNLRGTRRVCTQSNKYTRPHLLNSKNYQIIILKLTIINK
ncbi:hypothetical protein Mgra_00002361, partial [Meloidogyne graminicola]